MNNACGIEASNNPNGVLSQSPGSRSAPWDMDSHTVCGTLKGFDNDGDETLSGFRTIGSTPRPRVRWRDPGLFDFNTFGVKKP